MAQQRRMIYAKAFSSHTLNMLPVEARYLFIAMIVLADDDGRLNGDERYLKGQVFSYDEKITTDMVKGWRDVLAQQHQIVLYERENNQYISHPKWEKYQAIRGDMYIKSRIPKPTQNRNDNVTEMVHKLNQVKLSKDKLIGEHTPSQQSLKFFGMSDQEILDFCQQFSDKTGIATANILSEVKKFISYWTEKNKSGTKQKWQLETTFEVQRRLLAWFRNAQKWSKEQLNKYQADTV